MLKKSLWKDPSHFSRQNKNELTSFYSHQSQKVAKKLFSIIHNNVLQEGWILVNLNYKQIIINNTKKNNATLSYGSRDNQFSIFTSFLWKITQEVLKKRKQQLYYFCSMSYPEGSMSEEDIHLNIVLMYFAVRIYIHQKQLKENLCSILYFTPKILEDYCDMEIFGLTKLEI